MNAALKGKSVLIFVFFFFLGTDISKARQIFLIILKIVFKSAYITLNMD